MRSVFFVNNRVISNENSFDCLFLHLFISFLFSLCLSLSVFFVFLCNFLCVCVCVHCMANKRNHRIKIPDGIRLKFGTVDYVDEETRFAKFYANPSNGGFSANG